MLNHRCLQLFARKNLFDALGAVRLVGNAGDADGSAAASSFAVNDKSYGDTDDGKTGRARRGFQVSRFVFAGHRYLDRGDDFVRFENAH